MTRVTSDTSAGGEGKTPLRPGLKEKLKQIGDGCVACPSCRDECAFIKKYGTPRQIAEGYDPSDHRWLTLAYECSLCGLCAAVCPKGLRPEEMFLEMRREAVARGAAPLKEHQGLLAYEKRGTSRLFSYYGLPRNCRTVFFPGCALPGTRPDLIIRVYEHLRQHDPSLGMVLDCCGCPSHDLGRADCFTAMLGGMKSFLTGHGVKRIITACPNCQRMFRLYGAPLETATVYEMLLEAGMPDTGSVTGLSVSVHDPCAARSSREIHEAVRRLAAAKGFTIVEMDHAGENTLCCGEGGNAGAVAPDFAAAWADRRREEAGGRPLLTYCAGCVARLGGRATVFHILDAVLDPRSVGSGKARASRSPVTYFNRLRVKGYLRKRIGQTDFHRHKENPTCRSRNL